MKLASFVRSLARPAVTRLAARVAQSRRAQKKERAAHQERLRQQWKADLASRRVAQRAAKQEAEAERALRRRQSATRLEEERLVREATAAKAYEHYLQVRDRMRRPRDVDSGTGPSLTEPEERMVTALTHLWDADRETIASLRRCCEPIGGIRASDYEVQSDLAVRLKRELAMLRRQIGELFVQEPSTLGGFGYSRRGEQYNEETLKFFHALIALQDGAVLGSFRNGNRRRLVWDIGGGWGGFAYQFKTICPNVTYVITGIPELLLVSAVYLMTAFPEARSRVYDEACRDDFWRGWEEVDFVFVPESALPAFRPPRVDLTLDIMTLRNMGAERVRAHVQRAFDLGSPYVYSLRSARWPEESAAAWTTIERLYWPHPIPPRGDIDPEALAIDPGAMPDSDYGHLVGWRRMRV